MNAIRCSDGMDIQFPLGAETHTYARSLTQSLSLRLISSRWLFCLLINAENITTISSFPISIPVELGEKRRVIDHTMKCSTRTSSIMVLFEGLCVSPCVGWEFICVCTVSPSECKLSLEGLTEMSMSEILTLFN